MPVSQITPSAASTWRSRAGDTPAGLAVLYRDAAQRIRTSGYDAATVTGDYEGSHGISITIALRQAAETCWAERAPERGLLPREVAMDAADLAEELETRLAAVLYLTGQLTYRTGIRDLPDCVAGWERDLPQVEGSWPVKYRWHTQDEALAVLETAAALLDSLGGAS
jgi:hypothetical protein